MVKYVKRHICARCRSRHITRYMQDVCFAMLRKTVTPCTSEGAPRIRHVLTCRQKRSAQPASKLYESS